MQFVYADAAGLPFPPDVVFDLAYARLLLSHLAEPVAVLRAMRAALRPGGVVAIEDLCTDTLRCQPADGGPGRVARHLQRHGPPTRRRPGHRPRPAALLRAAGFDEIREDTVANPMTTAGEKLYGVTTTSAVQPHRRNPLCPPAAACRVRT